MLLHRRLCHLGEDGIRRLAGLRIPGISVTAASSPAIDFCQCCVMGKSTVANINRQSSRDHDPPVCFHSMAVDLWGPLPQKAIGGYLYVLGAICFRTNYHLAELLKPKSDAPTVWRRILLRIRALGYAVVSLRVDNDSVLLGRSFMAVCDEFGVSVERTAPYRHHQLARIERHWRTMGEAVTALLQDSGLPLCFRGFAFITAAFVKNRVWDSGAQGIPFQLVTSTVPDLSFLRIFGCPAFVHIEKGSRRKLQPKAWKGIFVGYAPDSPAYLIYNPATRSVIRSQNVTFHESWRDSLTPSTAHLHSLNLGEKSSHNIEIQVNGRSIPTSEVIEVTPSRGERTASSRASGETGGNGGTGGTPITASTSGNSGIDIVSSSSGDSRPL